MLSGWQSQVISAFSTNQKSEQSGYIHISDRISSDITNVIHKLMNNLNRSTKKQTQGTATLLTAPTSDWLTSTEPCWHLFIRKLDVPVIESKYFDRHKRETKIFTRTFERKTKRKRQLCRVISTAIQQNWLMFGSVYLNSLCSALTHYILFILDVPCL